MAQRHTQRKNVYEVCQRCGATQPLSEMKWQNGILICSTYNCVDKAIIGSRDIAVAKAIEVYRHELEPDPKMTNPVERKQDQTEVLY
jgi:hypothetical protein